MKFFFDRVNTVPIFHDEFPYEFKQWLANTADTLNEVISNIETGLNLLAASPFTTTQINDMFSAGDLPNGVLLYDTVLNVYVGNINGSLVKFTTTAYP